MPKNTLTALSLIWILFSNPSLSHATNRVLLDRNEQRESIFSDRSNLYAMSIVGGEEYCQGKQYALGTSLNISKCIKDAVNSKVIVGDIYYTIFRKIGIDTNEATIELIRSQDDITFQCSVRGRGDSEAPTPQKIKRCIERGLQENSPRTIKADCIAKRLYDRDRTLQYGWFEKDWNFKDVSGNGELISQTTADGYFTALEKYYALCPSQNLR